MGGQGRPQGVTWPSVWHYDVTMSQQTISNCFGWSPEIPFSQKSDETFSTTIVTHRVNMLHSIQSWISVNISNQFLKNTFRLVMMPGWAVSEGRGETSLNLMRKLSPGPDQDLVVLRAAPLRCWESRRIEYKVYKQRGSNWPNNKTFIIYSWLQTLVLDDLILVLCPGLPVALLINKLTRPG